MNESRPPRTLALLVPLLVVWLLAVSSFCAAAEEWTPVYHPEMEASRTVGSIRIDGELDDSGWVGAARAGNFTEHSPGDQVEPPVEDEALTGEPHDLPDPGTVAIRVAMDLAVFACGLGVLGAIGPPGHGVAQEVRAVGAQLEGFYAKVHLEAPAVDPGLFRGLFVFTAAVDIDELGEDPVVLINCAHSWRPHD